MIVVLLGMAPMLSACLVQSEIQGRYVEDQGDCRSDAESNIGNYEKPNMTPKDRNAQLVTLFSNCMGKKGWQVAKPKRVKTAVTTDGPHGPLDPYGSTATSAARTVTTTTTTTAGPQPAQGYGGYQQPATQAPVGQRPVQTMSTPLSPSGGMPPLSQPSTGGSYYQPGNAYYAPSPTYGGAGRNF